MGKSTHDSTISEQPHIIIEPDLPSDIERRIEAIDTRINQEPEIFQKEISKLGELAIKPIAYSERDNRVVHAAREAGALIGEFFTNRYDLEIAYDDETETALRGDKKYLKLLEESRGASSIVIKTGVMSSTLHSNPNAEHARDASRIYRLKAYVDRVATWQTQVAAQEGRLPSAG